MTDIRVKELSTTAIEGPLWDWVLRIPSKVLDDRDELATAVRIALGTDALSDEKEILPDPDSVDRRGWWGDLDAERIWGGWPIGCKNWLLTRAKITEAPAAEGSTLQRAKQYTLAALQPFIDKRVVTHVEVEVTRTELQRIDVHAILYRGEKKEIDLRYQMMWEEEPPEDKLASTAINTTIRVPYRNFSLSSVAPTPFVLYQNIVVPSGNIKLTSAPIDPSLVRMIISQGNLAFSSVAPFVSTVQTIRSPAAGQLTISSLGRIMLPARRDLALSSVRPTVGLTNYPEWTPGVYVTAGQRKHYSPTNTNWECISDHYMGYPYEPGGAYSPLLWVQL